MRKLFYARLAFSNLRKNARVYLPFIFSSALTVAMCYILLMLPGDAGLRGVRGEAYLKSTLMLGAWVVGIFAVIFLFYTSSFLTKRRKTEFGLLNVLGMEKKHIARVLLFETFYLGSFSLLLGLLLGFALSKSVLLFLTNLVGLEVRFGLSFSPSAAGATLVLFGAIFFLIFLNSVRQIHFASAVELLKGGNVGEKEPKTRWLLTLIGLLALAGGYTIALVTKNPMYVLALFFVAVILVIIGTYCLFTAGNIAVLKLMRRNKKYYYQPEHFISVSGMIYRMKQNAVGLANICILSTMVLVMISSTLSLYAGTEDMLYRLYPQEIGVECYEPSEFAQFKEDVVKAIADSGLQPDQWIEYRQLIFAAAQKGDRFLLDRDDSSLYFSVTSLCFMPLSDFNRMTGRSDSLESGQVLAFPYQSNTLSVLDYSFEVVSAEGLDKVDMPGRAYYTSQVGTIYIIVPDSLDIAQIAQKQAEVYGRNSFPYTMYIGFDLPGLTSGEKEQAYEDFSRILGDLMGDPRIYSQEAQRIELYSFNGSLFFLGLFLGILFLIAVVLIMYYKQLSEGYEDKRRFAIMRKVGLSRSEIKSSIRSQVLILFYLPLLAACCHILFAFPFISRLFMLLELQNVRLFFLCTICSVALFALIYAGAYALTARTYYRIVGEDA